MFVCILAVWLRSVPSNFVLTPCAINIYDTLIPPKAPLPSLSLARSLLCFTTCRLPSLSLSALSFFTHHTHAPKTHTNSGTLSSQLHPVSTHKKESRTDTAALLSPILSCAPASFLLIPPTPAAGVLVSGSNCLIIPTQQSIAQPAYGSRPPFVSFHSIAPLRYHMFSSSRRVYLPSYPGKTHAPKRIARTGLSSFFCAHAHAQRPWLLFYRRSLWKYARPTKPSAKKME